MRLILLVAWLFAEAWSIGKATQFLGGLPVLIILILIAMAGVRLIQSQGLRTVANIQTAMQRNELPAVALLDALIVFIAGVLLVVPGFLSDLVALFLLLSGLRRSLAHRVSQFIAAQNPDFRSGVVIDGDYENVTEVHVIEHRDDADSDKKP